MHMEKFNVLTSQTQNKDIAQNRLTPKHGISLSVPLKPVVVGEFWPRKHTHWYGVLMYWLKFATGVYLKYSQALSWEAA